MFKFIRRFKTSELIKSSKKNISLEIFSDSVKFKFPHFFDKAKIALVKSTCNSSLYLRPAFSLSNHFSKPIISFFLSEYRSA